MTLINKSIFLENDYTKKYYSLINAAIIKNVEPNTYYEAHHIIPKSIGGRNDSSNLVNLTPKEHFQAHHLLTEMTAGRNKSSMIYAFWTMANVWNQHQESRYIPTPEEYEIAVLKRRLLETRAETRTKIAASKKGKISVYNVEIDKMKFINSDELDYYISLGYTKGERPKSDNHRQLISATLKGSSSMKKGLTFEEMYGIKKAKELRAVAASHMAGKTAWNKGDKQSGFGSTDRVNPMKNPESIKKMLETRRKNKGKNDNQKI